MGLVAWVLFGLLVGLVANLIDPRPTQGGVLGAMLLGIAGALVGGFLGSLLLGVSITGFNLSSFFVAVIGSLILLAVQRAFR